MAYLNEHLPVWRTCTWDFNGLAIGSVYSAIAISSTCMSGLALQKNQKTNDIPVGFTPDWNPNSGTRLGSIESPVVGAADVGAGAGAAVDVGAGATAVVFTAVDVAFAGAGAGAGALGWASMASDCALKVVETTGHPLPGPLRF